MGNPTTPVKGRPVKVGLSTPAKLILAALCFVSICSFGLDTQSRSNVVTMLDTNLGGLKMSRVLAKQWFTIDEREIKEIAYLKVGTHHARGLHGKHMHVVRHGCQ